MKFIEITRETTLKELSDLVGSRNVDTVLHMNGLKRTPYIGRELIESQGTTILSVPDVTWQRKHTLLSGLSSDYDLFEYAATMGEAGWKLLSNRSMFPNTMQIPPEIDIPDGSNVLGNGVKVPESICKTALYQISSEDHHFTVDPSIFNEYNVITNTQFSSNGASEHGGDLLPRWFKIPWGEVTLYSSLNHSDYDNLHHDHEDFPVYPEEVSDGVSANYTTMPDLIYQYEPWQLYTGSGPRTNTYTFNFHRDMWTGDHRDGGANRLIRFCQANCYPKYKGSSVQTSIVTLYVGGSALISGILTNVDVDWSGPLGLDSWYLVCKLSLTITEVSNIALNFDSVRTKPLIG